jgi:primosomal protein N' (replication factor Y)
MGKQQQSLFDDDPAPWDMDDASEVGVAAIVFAEFPFGPYDYLIPDAMRTRIQAGVRVKVPLGRGNRQRIGYCIEITNRSDHLGRLKPITQVLDRETLLSPLMLRLAHWISDHYLSPLGQVLDAMVPAGVRAQAGTRGQVFLSVSPEVVSQLDTLKLSSKQRQALKILASAHQPLTPLELANAVGCTLGPVQALRKKQLVRSEVRRVNQRSHDLAAIARESHLTLNSDQQRALEAILGSIRQSSHKTILIHGVTGSGKTEVYIQAIDEVIQYGRQAIVLVPEISLTPQTQQRFRSRFDRVAVLHSHLNPAERHWHWQRIASGEIQVIVGARSAIFAPAPNLGLIVLDEEHDASFKQDSSPRYHTRDVAIQRAQMEEIPLVLGSATPSLESWLQARRQQFQLVEIPERVSARPLPDVAIVDLRSEMGRRRTRGAISRPLFQAMREALRADGQVILLLNRRGFSTSIQCPACGHVVKCPDCDIALTHHREGERAVCHYCDHEIRAPSTCPECQFDGIRYAGLGTQRLEAEVRSRFPDEPCLRMDSDSMQRFGSHEKALDRFRSGEIKILLGTQMIAKGLDFPNVMLVGVINADTALHFPDFRAAERTFQLVTQVAGRTGRGPRGGRVLVQTFSPEHPAILAAARHDYVMFAEQELPVRQEFDYPPFSTMARIVVRGPDAEPTEEFADQLSDRLHEHVEAQPTKIRVLGPAEAPMPKLRGKFRFHLLLHGRDRTAVCRVIEQTTETLSSANNIIWTVDIDPVDML